MNFIFRDLRKQDAKYFLTAKNDFSENTLYQRFHSKPHFNKKFIKQLTDLDGYYNKAFIALSDDKLVAIARWARNENNEAEIAFIVADKYQSLGIGTFLIKWLKHEGKEKGIDVLSAYIQADNQKIYNLLTKNLGQPFKKINDGNSLELFFSI